MSTIRSTDDEDYTPTLLQYAELVVWLDERRGQWHHLTPAERRHRIPEHLKRVFDDATERAALGRVAKAMQAAEDAGDDGLGDMFGSWSE